MPKLDGITNLRERSIIVKDIENPVLKRVLCERLNKDKFNFWYNDSSYKEYKDGTAKSSHTDKHNDSVRDEHNDGHYDYLENQNRQAYSYNDTDYNYSDNHYNDVHSDHGYSETKKGGYSEHIIIIKMPKLDGITNLRGKTVVLENIGNRVLKKILHFRLRGNKFNFSSYDDKEGYTQHTDSPDPYNDSYKDSHTDKYTDNHRDSHKDNHDDYMRNYDDVASTPGCYEYYPSHNDHIDKGYSESVSYGYNEHTDYYS